MAIRTVVTRGYGNGTFNGTIPLVVTRGYAIGAEIVIAGSVTVTLQSRSQTATMQSRSMTGTLDSRSTTLTITGRPG